MFLQLDAKEICFLIYLNNTFFETLNQVRLVWRYDIVWGIHVYYWIGNCSWRQAYSERRETASSTPGYKSEVTVQQAPEKG